MRLSIVVSIIVIMTLGGCISPHGRRGRVLEGNYGDTIPDFTFMDQEGRTHSFSQHLGDYSVLTFTKCDGKLHKPISTELTELVNNNQEPGYVDTVGFDIHWSEDGCKHAEKCHLIENKPRIFSICDARSVVRNLYNAHKDGHIVVIGPDHKIVFQDSTSNMDSVKNRLHRMFSEHLEFAVLTWSPDD